MSASLWQKVAALLYVVVSAGMLVAFRSRLHADLWPVDDSRVAPNILATCVQIALATPVVVLLWPPTRRRVHRFVSRHTEPLRAQLAAARQQRERLHSEALAAHEETQRHLRHLILHSPDIPPLPEKE